MSWVDPLLTDKGVEQAKGLGKFWTDAIATDHMPLPQRFCTSPLTRCLQTTHATWSDVPLPDGGTFQPMVIEAARELFGVHTCDKRGTRTAIEARFPAFEIEPEMPEETNCGSQMFEKQQKSMRTCGAFSCISSSRIETARSFRLQPIQVLLVRCTWLLVIQMYGLPLARLYP